MSRSPSPTRFTASTVSDSTTAGKATICGLTCHSARPSVMMLPHDGMSGGVPAPMKDRIASITMAEAQI